MAANLTGLGFQGWAPAPSLRRWVRGYWSLRTRLPLAALREEYIHASGRFGVVFNFGELLFLDGQPVTARIFADAANASSRKFGMLGVVDALGINFLPGAARMFFGLPLGELRDLAALGDGLSTRAAQALYQALEGLQPAERVALLNDWLGARLQEHPAPHASLLEALQSIQQEAGNVQIPAVARAAALSQRQLERLFYADVGLSPKLYARVLRVEQLRVDLLRTPATGLAWLAAERGFFDEAHAIREFKTIIGMTPRRYGSRIQRRLAQDESDSDARN